MNECAGERSTNGAGLIDPDGFCALCRGAYPFYHAWDCQLLRMPRVSREADPLEYPKDRSSKLGILDDAPRIIRMLEDVVDPDLRELERQQIDLLTTHLPEGHSVSGVPSSDPVRVRCRIDDCATGTICALQQE